MALILTEFTEMGIVFILLCLLPASIEGTAVVTVLPENQAVSYPNGAINFFCLSSSSSIIVSVNWMLNNTFLNDMPDSSDISAEFSSAVGGTLRFFRVSKMYNSTEIRCIASLSTGDTVNSSDVSMLLLQGTLAPVTSPNISSTLPSVPVVDATISWEAPFTLDLTGVDPDITYCVTVTSTASLEPLNLMCGIATSEVRYSLPLNSWCYHLNVCVIPVNLAGNGSVACSALYTSAQESPVLQSLSSTTNGITLTMSDGVCSGSLNFNDRDTGERVLIDSSDLDVEGNIINASTASLRDNRHYDLEVMASNALGSQSSYAETEISTHDIQTASISEITSGEVEASISFTPGSLARGALLIIHGGVGTGKSSLLLPFGRDMTINYTLSFGLPAGQFKTFWYDIEGDGTLTNGVNYPAVTGELTKMSTGTTFRPSVMDIESCAVSTVAAIITVECTYSSNSLASGFQVIAQQISNSSQVHKLYVEQTTHTIATVEVEETGVYQVSIFPLREGTGILDSNVEYTQQLAVTIPEGENSKSSTGVIIGSVFGGVVFVVFITVIVILLCYQSHLPKKPQIINLSKHNGSNAQPHEEMEDISKLIPCNTSMQSQSQSSEELKAMEISPESTDQNEAVSESVIDIESEEGSYPTQECSQQSEGVLATSTPLRKRRPASLDCSEVVPIFTEKMTGSESRPTQEYSPEHTSVFVASTPTKKRPVVNNSRAVTRTLSFDNVATPKRNRDASLHSVPGISAPMYFRKDLPYFISLDRKPSRALSESTLWPSEESNAGSSKTVRAVAHDVFKSQHSALMVKLQRNLPSIANKLYSESIISAAALAEATNQVHVASVRTVSLLNVMEDKIRAEPHVFIKFVKILESESTLKPLAKTLFEEYLKGDVPPHMVTPTAEEATL